MQLHRPILLAMVACLAALSLPVLVYRKVTIRPVLSISEQAVAGFTPSPLSVASKDWQNTSLTLPVTTAASAPMQHGIKLAAPGTAASAGAPPPPPTPPPSVSFILQDGGKGMAIIGGAVLKEGDHYQHWLVERIERNRVLLRGRKGTIWLTLQ